VAKLAPFLTLDGAVYPVVAGRQLDWVVDGYTTTGRYPAAAGYDLTAAAVAAGGPAPAGPATARSSCSKSRPVPTWPDRDNTASCRTRRPGHRGVV
jgi:hypothetical protein